MLLTEKFSLLFLKTQVLTAQHPWKALLDLHLLDMLLFIPTPFAPQSVIFSDESLRVPHLSQPNRNDATDCGEEMTSALTDICCFSQKAGFL